MEETTDKGILSNCTKIRDPWRADVTEGLGIHNTILIFIRNTRRMMFCISLVHHEHNNDPEDVEINFVRLSLPHYFYSRKESTCAGEL